MSKKTVLITGASGLVGNAALEHFLNEPEWEVIAVSRRKPEVDSRRSFQHLSIDLRDTPSCEKAFGNLGHVTHVVFAALSEKHNALVEGWFDSKQMDVNRQMLYNLLEPLAKVAKGLTHVSLMQGAKAYGVHIHPIPIPARENLPRDKHENFYWLQEDYLRKKASEQNFTFTILRPPVIFGSAYGVAMSILPVLGAYAAICREMGEPFGFPGGPREIFQAIDARLLAKIFAWAALSPAAANKIFNVTNGDISEWRNLWPAIARTLGVEVGPDKPLEMAMFLPTKNAIWERIVQKYRLRPVSLPDLLGESHQFADVIFGAGNKEPRPPCLISDVELRRAGFCGVEDTETSICELLQILIKRNLLPAGR